jgi:O-antigen/teichoic acid export membrane protein
VGFVIKHSLGKVINSAGIASSFSLISALVTIAGYPLLVTAYSIEHIGAFGVFVSTVSMLATIGFLGSEREIIGENERYESIEILARCIRSFFWFLPFAVLLAIVVAGQLAYPEDESFSILIATLIFVSVVVIAGSSLCYSFCYNKSAGARIGLSRLIFAVATLSIQLFLHDIGLLGLCLGFFLGAVLSLVPVKPLWVSRMLFSQIRIQSKGRLSWFNLHYSSTQLLNNGVLFVLSFFIYNFFDAAFAGVFFIAIKLLNAPVTLVGRYFGDFFMAKYKLLLSQEPKAYLLIFKRLTMAMLFFAILGLMIVIILPNEFLKLFFGEQYVAGHSQLQLLSVPYFLMFSLSLIRFEQGGFMVAGFFLALVRVCLVFLALIVTYFAPLDEESFLIAISICLTLACFIRYFVYVWCLSSLKVN